MLLRRSLIFSGKAWTRAHREWLRSLKLEGEADRAVFDDYLRAVELLEDRLATIEQKLEEVAQLPRPGAERELDRREAPSRTDHALSASRR